MRRKLILFSLCLVVIAACKKKEAPPPEPAPTATLVTAAPPSATMVPQPSVMLPEGAPIPATGVALWLIADDAKPGPSGKLESWSNTAVLGITAVADKAELRPSIVPHALNGHAVIRFDGVNNMLMTNIDISPARMPDATVFAVFNSKTDAASPLRKLYGDDDGGYDRAVGLDDRAGSKNYAVFSGQGAEGYFTLKANETYVTADQYTKNEFDGWINGKSAVQKVTAAWETALPNLYIGGTGTVYHEPWQGDLAEIIVYARPLTDSERKQVEDYLGKKYGVTIAR